MAKEKTEGRCYSCDGIFSKTKIKKHVESCGKTKNSEQQTELAKNKKMKEVFHIVIFC